MCACACACACPCTAMNMHYHALSYLPYTSALLLAQLALLRSYRPPLAPPPLPQPLVPAEWRAIDEAHVLAPLLDGAQARSKSSAAPKCELGAICEPAAASCAGPLPLLTGHTRTNLLWSRPSVGLVVCWLPHPSQRTGIGAKRPCDAAMRTQRYAPRAIGPQPSGRQMAPMHD